MTGQGGFRDNIVCAAGVDGPYRYWLTRVWDPLLPRTLFVMLNPSAADQTTDDPTIRKCVGFAKRWGFGSLEVVNLYACRATEPGDLKKYSGDRVGPGNRDSVLDALGRADRAVLAWGNHAKGIPQQASEIKALLAGCRIRYDCLGLTKKGQPRHPLMVPYSQERVPVILGQWDGGWTVSAARMEA